MQLDRNGIVGLEGRALRPAAGCRNEQRNEQPEPRACEVAKREHWLQAEFAADATDGYDSASARLVTSGPAG
jgi:hypothetical protein